MIQAYCPHCGMYPLTNDEARKLTNTQLTPRTCLKKLGCNEEIDIYLNGALATNQQIQNYVGKKIIK